MGRIVVTTLLACLLTPTLFAQQANTGTLRIRAPLYKTNKAQTRFSELEQNDPFEVAITLYDGPPGRGAPATILHEETLRVSPNSTRISAPSDGIVNIPVPVSGAADLLLGANPTNPLPGNLLTRDVWYTTQVTTFGTNGVAGSRYGESPSQPLGLGASSVSSGGWPAVPGQIPAGSGGVLGGGGTFVSGNPTLGLGGRGEIHDPTIGLTSMFDARYVNDNQNEVDGADVLDGSLTGADIATGTITGSDIATGSISGSDIADASLTGADIVTGSISGSNIADGTITSIDIADGGITGTDISDGTVTSIDIADGGITGTDIATDTITASNIADGSIQGLDIADGSIGGADIITGGITATNIADGTITDLDIADGGITGTSISDFSLTGNDIAPASINDFHIIDGGITGADIADHAITGYEHISPQTITGNEIAFGTIQSIKIADETIRTTDIQNGTITGADIANGTITGSNIATGTMTGANIADGSITGIDIGIGAITGNNIQPFTLDGADISIGSGQVSMKESFSLVSGATTFYAFNVGSHASTSGWNAMEIRAPSDANPGFQMLEMEVLGDNIFRFDADGDAFAEKAWNGGGADYADLIEISTGAESVEPGDVLAIDLHNPRAVVKSHEARSRLVAGIYSTQPAVLGWGERDMDLPGPDAQRLMAQGVEVEPISLDREDAAILWNEVPLAIVGIVPCKVSSENGPIHPGDLLVTAWTPGHAMRDDVPEIGTVLGKALGTLERGTGIIEVLVTLQ